MRLVSIATWTSGEPVSVSAVPYSDMICFLVALSSGTWLLLVSLRGAPGLVHPGSCESAADLTAGPGYQRVCEVSRPASRPRPRRRWHIWTSSVIDRVEPLHRAQPLGEVDGHPLPVQVQVVAVEHVRLDPAFGAVERRVGAHRDRRGQPLAAGPDQPARSRRRRRGPRPGGHVEVGGRVAQLAAAVVAVDDLALDAVRAPEDLGCAGDVAGSDARADVGR